jgi:hypothetical protein|tara:strand:+ start:263 stop:823 length:561 start_codon:yes stop_codon:yes gene_type:complete
MNRIILASIGIMTVYFLVMGIVFPDAMSMTEKRLTSPFFVVSQETKSISSGESFDFIIDTGITGGDSDMLILIIGFPDAKSFDEIKIKSSEFTQSPKFFEIGDQVKTYYPSNFKIAEYPLLHVFNMPNPINKKPILQLEITPENLGEFRIFTKAKSAPFTEDSIFPKGGDVDEDTEFVEKRVIVVE